jgi:hypothetical protein
LPKFDAGLLAQVKEKLGNLTENMQADCAQSRQAVFVRCILNIIYYKNKAQKLSAP